MQKHKECIGVWEGIEEYPLNRGLCRGHWVLRAVGWMEKDLVKMYWGKQLNVVFLHVRCNLDMAPIYVELLKLMQT